MTTGNQLSRTAIGAFASASGNYSIALGGGDSTNETSSTTQAKASNSIAIGRGAGANALNAIAIGRASKAYIDSSEKEYSSYSEGEMASSIAIGGLAQATKLPSIAIGSRASASGKFSTAIGPGDTNISDSFTNASADNSIAIGRDADANALSTIAIGRASEAKASGAIAIGSKTDDTTSTNTSAEAENSIAIGHGASVKQSFGNNGNATTSVPKNAVAIGYNAKAKSENSVAIGTSAVANHTNQITLGNENSIVYIPGKLVVKGDSYLSIGEGKTTYMKAYKRGDNNSEGRKIISLRFNQSLHQDRVSVLETGGYTNYGTLYKEANQNQINKLLSGDEISDALSLSDRRLKDVGKAFKGGLEEIKKLEVFNYTFKKDKSKTPRVGVMAQDLEKIFPNAVFKGEDGFLRIRMEDMFYAMVNAIKELDSKISILEQKQKKIDELESKVTKLEKRLADLEKKIK